MNVLSEIIYEHKCKDCDFTGTKNRYRQRVERDGDVVFYVPPRCAQSDKKLAVVDKIYIVVPDPE